MKLKILYALVLGLILVAWFLPFAPAPKPVAKEKIPGKSKVIIEPIFSGKPYGNIVVGGDCNIETINGILLGANAYVINLGTPLLLKGWGMDKDLSRLPNSVLLRLTSDGGSEAFINAKSGLPRNDVKGHFSLPNNLLASGFELNTKFQSVPTGEYAMTLIMVFDDIALACDNGRKVRIQ